MKKKNQVKSKGTRFWRHSSVWYALADPRVLNQRRSPFERHGGVRCVKKSSRRSGREFTIHYFFFFFCFLLRKIYYVFFSLLVHFSPLVSLPLSPFLVSFNLVTISSVSCVFFFDANSFYYLLLFQYSDDLSMIFLVYCLYIFFF